MARTARGATQRARKAAAKAARDIMAIEVGERLLWTRMALAKMDKAPKTQKDFAASVGISQTSYNQYETGEGLLVPENAVKIYTRYGVSLNWLYTGAVDDLTEKLRVKIEEARDETR